MLLSDEHEAAGTWGSNRVRETAGQMIVVSATVLVLDHERGAVDTFGDDVDSASADRRNLGLADRYEIHHDGSADFVETLG